MRATRLGLRAGVTLMVLLMIWPVAARADRVPVTRITVASPFPASCPAPYPFPDAEAEFTLAAEPNQPARLATAWIQGPLGSIVVGFSRDGGQTFKPVVIPQLQRCTGGSFDISSDPSLSAGPDGTLYLASLPGSVGGEASSIWVTRSRTGGRTWSRPVLVDHRDDDSQADDQETVTANPFNAGQAYVVWSERAKRPAPGGKTSTSPELFFARTSDRGGHWTWPRALSPEPPQLGVATGRTVVSSPGTLVCVCTSGRSAEVSEPSRAPTRLLPGEYQGLTAVPGGFLATFPQASPQARQGMTDGFAARIHIHQRTSTIRHYKEAESA